MRGECVCERQWGPCDDGDDNDNDDEVGGSSSGSRVSNVFSWLGREGDGGGGGGGGGVDVSVVMR